LNKNESLVKYIFYCHYKFTNNKRKIIKYLCYLKIANISQFTAPNVVIIHFRIRGSSRIQMNYLVGVLNGILFFVYMCL